MKNKISRKDHQFKVCRQLDMLLSRGINFVSEECFYGCTKETIIYT